MKQKDIKEMIELLEYISKCEEVEGTVICEEIKKLLKRVKK